MRSGHGGWRKQMPWHCFFLSASRHRIIELTKIASRAMPAYTRRAKAQSVRPLSL